MIQPPRPAVLLTTAAIILVLLPKELHGLASVSINELLSTCVDACSRGCNEIRAVQTKRNAGGSLRVDLKDQADPKSALTEADDASQAAIVDALRLEWGPELHIVGEEDGNNGHGGSAVFGARNIVQQKLRRDLCADISGTASDTTPLSDVTVFVDPLDGTREFVEERLGNCQALVGVAVAGKALAGVIGIPFPNGDTSRESTIVYGQVGAGHGMIGAPLVPSNEEYVSKNLPRPYTATGDSTAPVMVASRECAIKRFGGSNVLYGGAGNKILATALGHVDCTIQHRFGGPWDTCAPEAIIRSMGGKITDLVGDELMVHRMDSPGYSNQFGFVATGRNSPINHNELTDALRTSSVVQSYRKDVSEQL